MDLPSDALPFPEEFARRIAAALPDGAAARTIEVMDKIRSTGGQVILTHSEKLKAYMLVGLDDKSETVQ
jgi:hypothetical protein